MFQKTPLSLGIRLIFLANVYSAFAMTHAWATTPVLKRATPTTPVMPLTETETNIAIPQQSPAFRPVITPSRDIKQEQTILDNKPILLPAQSDEQPITTQDTLDVPEATFDTPANLTPITDTQTTKNPIPQKTLIPRTNKTTITSSPQHTQSLSELDKFYTNTTNQKTNNSRSCQGVWQYPYAITHSPNLVALANYGYYNAKNHAELSGNVIISQDNKQIRAGKLSQNLITGQGLASGRVLFGADTATPNGSLMGVANQLQYNMHTGDMVAHDVAFAHRDLSAHGYAHRLSTPSPSSYLVEQAIFSTCPPTDRVWHIRADQIHLDKGTGRGIAKNTTLAIKDVPVFYLPYFNFPIDDRRQSGFLLPRIGINSNDGLQVSTPYYLNLAPNYDATITPTVYTSRNPKISGEFRYLTQFGKGKIDTAYLPSDKEYHNKDRSHVFFEHDWRPFDDENLTIFAQYRHVSDSRYLSDFDALGLENNTLNLSRTLGASYHTPNLSANLKAEAYQKLEGTDRFGNLITDKDRPYSRLPELNLTYRLPSDVSPYANMVWTNHSGYFKKSIKDGSDTEKSGVRTYNELSMSRDFVKPWGYVRPKVALAHLYTSYDEASLIGQNLSKKDGTYSVFAPKLSLDSALHFEKQGSPLSGIFGKKGGYQLLTPRLKYLYTPFKDQSGMPNFETTIASPSYEQLLSDSWFLGYDRISDLHAITPALNYRYIDRHGNTRLDIGIADQFYLDTIKVGLNNSININQSHSGLSWQASVRPYQHMQLTTKGSFDHNNDLNTIIGLVSYTPAHNTLLNAGIVKRKRNDTFGQLPLHAYTISATAPINERWQIASTVQYDINNKQFMDALMGLTYNDCCIGISVYGRQYKNDLNPSEKYHHAIMAEIRLNGITGQGRLGKLLNEKILGFDKITW